MFDMNAVAMTCRLTHDPTLRRTPGGHPVTTMRVAIQRRRGSDGEDRGAAFWDVEAWGSLAEDCCAYLAKGKRIGVEGVLDHREWSKDGSPRHANYVIARRVQFLDYPDGAGDISASTQQPPADSSPPGSA